MSDLQIASRLIEKTGLEYVRVGCKESQPGRSAGRRNAPPDSTHIRRV